MVSYVRLICCGSSCSFDSVLSTTETGLNLTIYVVYPEAKVISSKAILHVYVDHLGPVQT